MNEFASIRDEFRAAADGAVDFSALQRETSRLLHDRMPGYDWAGYYMLDPEDDSMLVLGAYVGAATEHTRIPVSEGICGAAVAQARTVVVDDVRDDPRYIACSIETRSEIVAPIYVGGKIVGEIDIDSHEPARFSADDRVFVEECAAMVGKWLASHA